MNKKSVLLIIDPEWARAILAGEKEWEYRKIPPSIIPPYRMFLYATNPVGKIIGDVIVDTVLRDNGPNVLEMTIDDTPHTKDDIREYFGDRREYCALHIKQNSLNEYDEPIEIDGHPPNNFKYVTEDEILA